jgi:hypothetical protein
MNNNKLESLESRQMYSATLMSDATLTPVQEPAAVVAKTQPYLKITRSDILVSSFQSTSSNSTDAAKVTMQDFSFTIKVNKASPKLFLS